MLDCVRGLVLISMIAYHTVWDMVYIFGEDWGWYQSDLADLWQQSICCSFILLSGFCWSFGKVKWKRGLTVFLAGAVISVVTLLVMPKNRIVFGILTLLGTCMLFMIPLERVLKKIKPLSGIISSLLIFLFLKNINNGYLGFGDWEVVKLPRSLYSNIVTTFLGFTEDSFFSTDYFSVLPWLALFISGYFLYRLCVERNWLQYLHIGQNPFLEQLGRHSLIVYMLHQPLVYGVLTLVYLVK